MQTIHPLINYFMSFWSTDSIFHTRSWTYCGRPKVTKVCIKVCVYTTICTDTYSHRHASVALFGLANFRGCYFFSHNKKEAIFWDNFQKCHNKKEAIFWENFQNRHNELRNARIALLWAVNIIKRFLKMPKDFLQTDRMSDSKFYVVHSLTIKIQKQAWRAICYCYSSRVLHRSTFF